MMDVEPLSIPTYIQVLAEYYPQLSVFAEGDGSSYETLQSPDSLPTQEELDAKILQLVRKRMWQAIQAKRDYWQHAGVKVGSNWFHSDASSRIQQISLVMMGANMPQGIMWKTMQGTFVQMTPQLAGQIFQAIAVSDQTIYARAEYHRQNMILSSDPANYDYSAGWPMIYEESPEAAAAT